MTHGLTTYLKRFKREEDGNSTIEFVIMFPIFFVILLSAIEMGMMTYRNSMLERSLDLVVRDIRLNTGFNPTHDELKTLVCETVDIVPDCSDNLKLEMIQIDPRNWVDPPADIPCTDKSLETQPVSIFEAGQENELMLLRVCAKFEPLFAAPTISAFSMGLDKDEAGDARIVAMSAFVQEPR